MLNDGRTRTLVLLAILVIAVLPACAPDAEEPTATTMESPQPGATRDAPPPADPDPRPRTAERVPESRPAVPRAPAPRPPAVRPVLVPPPPAEMPVLVPPPAEMPVHVPPPDEVGSVDLLIVVDDVAAPVELPVEPAVLPSLVDKELRAVTIFYGTNRARAAGCAGVDSTTWNAAIACRPNAFYGRDPASSDDIEKPERALEVGRFTVTFPPDHEVGEIERPLQVFTIELRDEDPEEDVLISELTSYGRRYDDWVAEVARMGRTQAFIYVHGYGNAFEDAARTAAQVAYDLDYDVDEALHGLIALYSWPSGGRLEDYVADLDAWRGSIEPFNAFLDLLKSQATGITRVHVIAHSMGNELVTEALRTRNQPKVIDQLVLAAPDIPADHFSTKLHRVLPDFAERVTLYVSDNDKALQASSGLRGGRARAGEVKGGLLEASLRIDRFDAINASSLPSGILGHSYYANNETALGDIYHLLKGLPPEQRPTIEIRNGIWQFPDDDQEATEGWARVWWTVVSIVLFAALVFWWRRCR